MSGGEGEPPLGFVRVLYEFSYEDSDGGRGRVTPGERYSLLQTSTAEWWLVGPLGGGGAMFYLPARYVQRTAVAAAVVVGPKRVEVVRKRVPPMPPPRCRTMWRNHVEPRIRSEESGDGSFSVEEEEEEDEGWRSRLDVNSNDHHNHHHNHHHNDHNDHNHQQQQDHDQRRHDHQSDHHDDRDHHDQHYHHDQYQHHDQHHEQYQHHVQYQPHNYDHDNHHRHHDHDQDPHDSQDHVDSGAREHVALTALYTSVYTVHGRALSTVAGERLLLVERASSDWWVVCRPERRDEAFYTPASYVARGDAPGVAMVASDGHRGSAVGQSSGNSSSNANNDSGVIGSSSNNSAGIGGFHHNSNSSSSSMNSSSDSRGIISIDHNSSSNSKGIGSYNSNSRISNSAGISRLQPLQHQHEQQQRHWQH
ncbi:probable elastin-binding protein EbpS [Lethenteron reissneri]|uniref:probable elastin-binding protein EbpS n=1 Tax=Lethenteron reissneri TaxID=7753 RepID=UPI002AB7E7F5|nr:probable elastin-binding protein EbpS [Lethenteron reissneri]